MNAERHPRTPILRALDLDKTYGAGHAEIRAVDHVSLEVNRGELVIIMGPSGSGKTTLLSMLGALLRPSSGRIFIDDTEITALSQSHLARLRAKEIGFVFQSFNLLDALTVEENVLFPAQLAPGGIKAARSRGLQLLEQLGLSARAGHRPRTLSGGERQRVAIARALINQPPLLLADEPTGNLDSHSGQEVTMTLHDIARDQSCGVVIVTHDPRVEEVADRLLWLEDGALRERRRDAHAWVRDPVCGMRIDAWTATANFHYNDRKLVFCSQRCLERFQQRPQDYPIEMESAIDSDDAMYRLAGGK